MKYLGDFAVNKTVRIPFNTTSGAGASVTFTGTTIRIYKDGSTAERTSSNGVTLTKDFDGETGAHVLIIDLSDNTDAGFYASGHDYHAELHSATIDSQTVNAFLGSWSIENRSALRPTTADMTLDVSATGEAGLDFNNVKDATGAHTLTNITVPVVTTTGTATVVTTVNGLAANVITAASIATDAIVAAAVKADAVTKIQAGLATPTNITAGTITNLTNAPTAGDFTAAMKASLNNATPAVTVSDKAGFKLAADGLDQVVVETGVNARQALSLIAATTAGKSTGGVGPIIVYYAVNNPNTARVTATVDGFGDRTDITYNPPA